MTKNRWLVDFDSDSMRLPVPSRWLSSYVPFARGIPLAGPRSDVSFQDYPPFALPCSPPLRYAMPSMYPVVIAHLKRSYDSALSVTPGPSKVRLPWYVPPVYAVYRASAIPSPHKTSISNQPNAVKTRLATRRQ